MYVQISAHYVRKIAQKYKLVKGFTQKRCKYSDFNSGKVCLQGPKPRVLPGRNLAYMVNNQSAPAIAMLGIEPTNLPSLPLITYICYLSMASPPSWHVPCIVNGHEKHTQYDAGAISRVVHVPVRPCDRWPFICRHMGDGRMYLDRNRHDLPLVHGLVTRPLLLDLLSVKPIHGLVDQH